MREIKFRFWDYKFKKMDFGGGDCLLRRKGDDHSGIMQFTGLIDKNGEEVYEGDIIKRIAYYNSDRREEKIFSVKYHEPFACFSFENSIDGIATYGDIHWNKWSIEVIGNIYENPELLKGQ